MMEPTQIDDQTYNEAMSATPDTSPKRYFGFLDVDIWPGVWPKGSKPILFNPDVHAVDDRKLIVQIAVTPLAASGGQASYAIEREMSTAYGDWPDVIVPSLKALNTDLRRWAHKWCQIELVPNGSYQKNGVKKEHQAIKFLAFYETEQECRAANDAHFASRRGAPTTSTVTSPPPTAAPTPVPTATAVDPDRAAKAKFLPLFWKQSGQDISKFISLIAKDPQLSKHFDVDSPEVAAIILEA